MCTETEFDAKSCINFAIVTFESNASFLYEVVPIQIQHHGETMTSHPSSSSRELQILALNGFGVNKSEVNESVLARLRKDLFVCRRPRSFQKIRNIVRYEELED